MTAAIVCQAAGVPGASEDVAFACRCAGLACHSCSAARRAILRVYRRGSFLLPRALDPTTSPQSATRLEFLQVVAISEGIAPDQSSSQEDGRPRTQVLGRE